MRVTVSARVGIYAHFCVPLDLWMRNDACDLVKEIDIPKKEETSARAEGDGPIKGFSCQHHGGCGPKDRSSQTAITDRTNAERKCKRKRSRGNAGPQNVGLGMVLAGH